MFINSRPIRGVTAVVAGAGPAHAFYFATYEYSKEWLTKLSPQHNQMNYSKWRPRHPFDVHSNDPLNQKSILFALQ